MKNIETLVGDIYNLFDAGHACKEINVDLFGATLARVVADRLAAYQSTEARAPTLRASNIGRPCVRQTFYDLRGDDKEELLPHTKIKFLFGDIIEELLLFLATEAGHTVTDQQKECHLEGITGHIDAVIDGVLVDVKSASSYSFKKFRDGELEHGENDPFGYIGQMSTYTEALEFDRGAFLVMDKQNGTLCLHEPEELIDAKARINELKDATEGTEAPVRHYSPIADGKSGNMKLAVGCQYCGHKVNCWADANGGAGLRAFAYSTGPRFLTWVENLPKVPEIPLEEL